MKKQNDGGQAFPRNYAYINPESGRSEMVAIKGMTLRAYFAAKAMNRLVSIEDDRATYEQQADDGEDYQTWRMRWNKLLSERSVEQADALIEALKK